MKKLPTPLLTPEQYKELKEVSKPLMKFMAENFNPHTKVIVDSNSAELLVGSAMVRCDDFLVD
jgi:hypothetical protein